MENFTGKKIEVIYQKTNKYGEIIPHTVKIDSDHKSDQQMVEDIVAGLYCKNTTIKSIRSTDFDINCGYRLITVTIISPHYEIDVESVRTHTDNIISAIKDMGDIERQTMIQMLSSGSRHTDIDAVSECVYDQILRMHKMKLVESKLIIIMKIFDYKNDYTCLDSVLSSYNYLKKNGNIEIYGEGTVAIQYPICIDDSHKILFDYILQEPCCKKVNGSDIILSYDKDDISKKAMLLLRSLKKA